MDLIFKRGSLNFSEDKNGGFICQELRELSSNFAKLYTSDEIAQAIEARISNFRNWFELRFDTKEEFDSVPKEERNRRGAEIFDQILPSIRQSTEGLALMDQLMYWFGLWWFYHPEIRRQLAEGEERSWIYNDASEMVKKYILPLLPDQVRDNVVNANEIIVAVNSGHFAMLFLFENSDVRRIVTDTQLFELREVDGYAYLDITSDGKPITRSRCNRGGGRAFFDGVRLMSHDMFRTCAPKTVMIQGGYKVNSTGCTIANGMLFDLIDVNDKVAHTTGAFMGCNPFSNAEAVESFLMTEESGRLMRVENKSVILCDEAILPLGVFMPSRVTLLDNGFTLYDWSDFEKLQYIRYTSVLAVDDSQQWLDRVRDHFDKMIQRLSLHMTSDRHDALAKIMEVNPDAVLLDMHLNAQEQFEGLWISRELLKNDFQGKVMITSGYPVKQLQAMKTLIDDSIHIPGKDLARIEQCLFGECDCK